MIEATLFGPSGGISVICTLGRAGGMSIERAREAKFITTIRDKCIVAEDGKFDLDRNEALAVYKWYRVGTHDGFPLAAWKQEHIALAYLEKRLGEGKMKALDDLWEIDGPSRDGRPPGFTDEEGSALERADG